MTRYELILAHQACLEWMATNWTSPLPSTRVLGPLLNPTTPWGLTLCTMIATRLGRVITQDDAREIQAYL